METLITARIDPTLMPEARSIAECNTVADRRAWLAASRAHAHAYNWAAVDMDTVNSYFLGVIGAILGNLVAVIDA